MLRNFLPAVLWLLLLWSTGRNSLARTLITEGGNSEWRYSCTGALPKDWSKVEFDDSKWSTGKTPIGYGESNLTTLLKGDKGAANPQSAVFRKTFDLPEMAKGERAVLSLCVDDGAVVFVNGEEVKRVNMPKGELTADTLAVRQLPNDEEGFYTRIPVPERLLRPLQKNVVAVEVHQASASSSDLFFDFALRTIAPRGENPRINEASRAVIEAYYKGQCVPPGSKIPDGYIDGGRNMKFDAAGHASSGREIIVVDRTRDVELQKHFEFARSAALQQLTPRERAVRLAIYVDKIATPPGGSRWTGASIEKLEGEFTNQPIFIGEILEQCHSGVCRHRALLYKLLADEAGLKVALRRGNLRNENYSRGYPHAWNEVHLDDGTRMLVDSSYRAGNWDFPDVNNTEVVAEYRRLDNSALYGSDANKAPRKKD